MCYKFGNSLFINKSVMNAMQVLFDILYSHISLCQMKKLLMLAVF